ncbi:MAG: polysaccharide biosynthesis tyrosine autokinase [candidate division Zixibacteria bacterium]|nr:polysaccharide biosynthesis tyrosine autokinase [candidate division Zixibacteria bacterium]
MEEQNSISRVQKEVSFQDYLIILKRRRWIVLSAFLIILLSSGIFSFTTQPIYESSTTLMIEEDGGMKKEIFEISSYMKQETMIKNQVEIIKSRTLAESVLQALLSSPFKKVWEEVVLRKGAEKVNTNDMVLTLQQNTKVVPLKETDIVQVKVTAPNPDLAAFLTNTIAQEYYKQSLQISRGEITEVRLFLEDQLSNTQKELQQAEEALRIYKEREKVAALPEETEELVKQLASFESLYNEAKTDLESNQKRLSYMRNQLTERKGRLVEDISQISSPLIIQLRKEMANLEGIKAGYIAQGFPEDHPKMEEITNRIKDIKQKLVKETSELVSREMASSDPLGYSQELVDKILILEIEIQSLGAKTEALKNIVDTYSNNLNTLPEKSLKLARLERNAKVGENIFLMLKEKYEESRIKEAGQIGNVRIIDKALPPEDPIKPKKKINLLLGALLGLGLGLGMAFFVERLDNSLKSIEDVEATGLSILGSIPLIKSSKDKKSKKEEEKSEEYQIKRITSNLVTHFEPKSPISEAYRTFRTNLQFARLDAPLKTILVTSSGPSEGKSTTVANLAITMAQMGTNTILIDSDLRRPVLHSIFNLQRAPGLTNYLAGNVPWKEIVQKTPIENLSLLTCGVLPPNPSELLGSKKMRMLLEELKEKYDMILFDSPPVIAVTDAAVLSTLLDGVVLVSSSGSTSREALQRAITLLENVKSRLIGGVLNKIKVESVYGSYHYYYYYHYYGGTKQKRKKKSDELVKTT